MTEKNTWKTWRWTRWSIQLPNHGETPGRPWGRVERRTPPKKAGRHLQMNRAKCHLLLPNTLNKHSKNDTPESMLKLVRLKTREPFLNGTGKPKGHRTPGVKSQCEKTKARKSSPPGAQGRQQLILTTAAVRTTNKNRGCVLHGAPST